MRPRLLRENVCRFVVQLSVDARDLLTPAPAFAVFGIHQLFLRPVEVVSDEGHLLVELLEGIARQTSPRLWSSTSISSLQLGQATFRCPLPLPFVLIF